MSAASSAKASQPAASSSGSLSFEQTAVAWTDIEAGEAVGSEGPAQSIAQSMRRMFPPAQPPAPDNQPELLQSAQGPPQLPSAARGFAPGEQGRPGPMHGMVAVPPILAEWVTSPDAADVLAKILGVARARLRGVEQNAVRFEAEEEEAVQEAQGLLQSHLDHKAGVEEKRRVKRELELIEQEFRDGLRCEFQVPLQALPHVFGVNGSNLAQVQAECGVERVLVDSDESMVRIVGRSREAVAAARSRLEYDVWCLPTARDLLQSSGNKIEALLERVRTKNKLAEAEVQEDEQGPWVSLVGCKAVLAEAARVVEGQLQLFEMMQAEAAEVADVSEEQVQRVSRTWGVQPRSGPPAGGPPFFAAPARLPANTARAPSTAQSREPRAAAQATTGEWEDIEPPLMGPDQKHASGWGSQTGSPGQGPAGSAARPTQLARLQPRTGAGAAMGATSNGVVDGTAGVAPTGWGQAAAGGHPGSTTGHRTGPALGQGSLPAVSQPAREASGPTQVAGGSGGWGEVPAFQHDVRGGAEPRIVTRRPLAATPNRLAASVLATVVSSRQKEGAQISRGRGGLGASPEKGGRANRSGAEGEMKGRATGGQIAAAQGAEQDYQGSSLGARDEEPPGATGWGDTPAANSGGLQVERGRGQIKEAAAESGFWTLGSPPGATPAPPLDQESVKSTWDAAWPNSAVAGRTNWGQQRGPEGQTILEGRGSAQRSGPPGPAAPAPLPGPAASSEHASSGWRGQPRSAASGSLSSSQPGASISRGEPSTASSGPAPRRRVERINANAVPPPDVSTLLRAPSGKAGVRPVLAAPSSAPAAAEPLISRSAAAGAPSRQPGAAPPAKAPAYRPEDAVVLVTASEGSGSGRVPPQSRPLIGRPSTTRSQPQAPKASPVVSLEREAPRTPAQDVRSASLPKASGASKGSVSERPERKALLRAVSSASSTGSTSNSKLANRGQGEVAGRGNGPGQVAPLGAFQEDTQEGANKEARRLERTQEEASLPEGNQEQEGEQKMVSGSAEGAHDPMSARVHAGAKQEAEGRGASVKSVRGSEVEPLGPAEVAEARDAAPDAPGRGERTERTEAATLRGQDGEEGAVAGSSDSDGVQAVEQGVGLVEDPAASHGASRNAACPGPKAGNESKAKDEARGEINGRSGGGQTRARKWASETSEEEQRFEEGHAAQHGAPQGEGPTRNGHEEVAREEAASVSQQGRVAGGPSGWGDAKKPEAEEKPSKWGTANHVNGGLEEVEDHPFAQRTGQGARPESGMRPWSDEAAAPAAPRGKGAGSGSWVSDDSGSVRSVGVDVGRWAEEAAISTLSEHEALLHDSPHGFEGATDSGSGRGGSTGSSRAGSSEGRRGPVYRMKMQKFQLAAIKANQVGGGPPTGWEAVPEEGATPGKGLPGTEPGPSVATDAPPAAMHSEPQDVRDWVRPKLRPDRAGPLLDTPGPSRRLAVPPAARAPHRAEPERQDRPPAPAQPTAADERAEPEGGFPAEEAVRATGWGDAEGAEQEALAGTEEVEARGWTEPPRRREEASKAGAHRGERRGGRLDERARSAEVYNEANGGSAQETDVAVGAEEPGAPTGWGGDVAGPSAVQSEPKAYPQDERGASGGLGVADYAEISEEREYGMAPADEAQPTGWPEEGKAERGGPYEGHTGVAAGEATREDPHADVSMEYEESWDGEDDASASEAESSPRGGLQKAPLRIGAQDVRLVEGTLPATALKRSTVNPTLLPGTQRGAGQAQEAASRMEVGVQDARLLPVERSERLERSGQRKKKDRKGKGSREKKERRREERRLEERRRRSGGSRTPQGASPGGDLSERGVLPGPLRQTPGASGNNTPSPSRVPPSGWNAGGGSPVTPASILQAVEQPSPGGRSSRLRKEGGGRGTKEQAQTANEGRTWQDAAEASVQERASNRAGASLAADTEAGILGKGGPVAPSRTSEDWPRDSTGRRASSQRRSAGNAQGTQPDAARDVSQDSSHLQREEGSSQKREVGSVGIEAAGGGKESDAGGAGGDADKQSSGSGGQRGSSGQSAKRAVRPSGVWSVRDRRGTSTSSA
ncbi:hypothetical protein KFL_002640140 [Klebsormidium nitens]|uniref:K Homology domain-containing protein n=1 Tax=Klebsormidium nitens TaxID=105231 RepID=A0A0U9HK88_KLENI|nr:hypothetical protein KFL_002640140 [Klebsormidium nitens]|eukprot:GAQ85993.1 hypothetical protein KFL_002640140 [Klebsormidium nitens]